MDESDMTTAEEYKLEGWILCPCGQRYLNFNGSCPWCNMPNKYRKKK